jgi:hypothetical protein
MYVNKSTGNNSFHTNNYTTNELDTWIGVLRQKLKFQLIKKLPAESLVVHYRVHKSSDQSSPRPPTLFV